MELFIKYLKQRRRYAIAGALFCFIFIISFQLYHLPLEAVLYPSMLCLLLSIIWVFFDFRRIKRKHRQLQSLQCLTDTMTQKLPPVDGIEEEDYDRLLTYICEEFTDYRTATDRKYQDLTDYYTVWVHQIKTPIASMRLQLQNEDSQLSRMLSADLFRIEQYVEMVLTFLRLHSGSTDYVIKEYDLDTILKQAVKKFAGEFINRGLRLVYEPVNTTVITDEKWLSFVMEQVLSNALKYTPSGSITISLREGKQLCIKDTGIGIAPEDLPRIFENGFTGYNGRTDKRASGIGLYLCKRICNNLGHKITAESVIDYGTCITIDLSQTKIEA